MLERHCQIIRERLTEMKKFLALVLSIAMLFTVLPMAQTATASPSYEDMVQSSANTLYDMGLFQGTGTDKDGNPIFELERTASRHEAVTMLVRLLGKEQKAKDETWTTPFTDVARWAKPYVGYAYENRLVVGTSATTFGGNQITSATQYLTFILRALGYESGTDFQWNKAWELTDQLDITHGEYPDKTAFTRGDMAYVSMKALNTNQKNSDRTLGEALGIFDPEPPAPQVSPEPTATPDPSTEPKKNKVQELVDYIATSEDAKTDSDGNKYIDYVIYGGGFYNSITYLENENKLSFSAERDDDMYEMTRTLISFDYDLAAGSPPETIVESWEYTDGSSDPVLINFHIDPSTITWDLDTVTLTQIKGEDTVEPTEEDTEYAKATLSNVFIEFDLLLNESIGLTLSDIGFPQFIIDYN